MTLLIPKLYGIGCQNDSELMEVMRNTLVVAQFLAISRYIPGETEENRENMPNSR